MAKKYIDAEALGIGKANRDAFVNPAYADGWNSAVDIIQTAPAADVVEVVRCGECKWQHNDRGTCPLQAPGDPYFDECPPDNFYCAAGEKMEVDEE